MTTYSYEVCPVCGIHYAVDATVMTYKGNLPSSDKNRGWHCPNGHSLVRTESEADKQRRRAERAEQKVAFWQEQADKEKRATAAVKGQLTKLRRRAAVAALPAQEKKGDDIE